MKSKSAKLLDLVLSFGVGGGRAVVLPDGGNTASLFNSYVNTHVPPCLAIWRVDKHKSAFRSGDGEVLIASDALVVSRDGEMIDLYFLD